MSDSTANPSPSSPNAPLPYAPVRESLRARAVRNSLWTVGSYAIFNIVRLVGNVVVTYYIAPELIGVMAIVNTVLIGIRLFSDVGIGPAVVTNPRGDTEPFLRTAFATQILRGFVIWLAAAALALPVAHYYASKDSIYSMLAVLLPIAGFVAVIEGLRSTAIFRLQRRLDLRRNAILEVIEVVFVTSVMIAWARIHPSIWALLIPAMLGTLLTTTISHFLLRDRVDRPQWHPDCAREMMRIGRWVFISTALTFFASQFERLIFGALVEPETLAVYWIAVNLAMMPFSAIAKLGSTVLFPTFSRVVDDAERFARVYARARTILLLAGGMFVCGILASSPFGIRMLYRAEYDDAGLMLQALTLSIWFQIIDTTNVAGLLARQKAHWMVSGNATKVVLMLAFVPLAFHSYGFIGALVALGLADACRAAVGTFGLVRSGVPLRSMRADFFVPLLIVPLGLVAYAVASHWSADITAAFPDNRSGRRLANLSLFGIAAAQVLIVFVPLTLWVWRRNKQTALEPEALPRAAS